MLVLRLSSDNNERKLADEGRGTARGTKKKVKGFRHVHYYGSTFTGNASPRSNFNLVRRGACLSSMRGLALTLFARHGIADCPFR